MKTKQVVTVTLATLGTFLCLAGLINTSSGESILLYWEAAKSGLSSVWKSKILFQPGCYGLVGIFLLGLVIQIVFPREKRRKAREIAKRNIETTKNKLATILKKHPQHRPRIDDDKAVKMKIANPKMSYRQVYDHFYPPKQNPMEELDRLKYFDNQWRSRVSQKVNAIIKEQSKELRKYNP